VAGLPEEPGEALAEQDRVLGHQRNRILTEPWFVRRATRLLHASVIEVIPHLHAAAEPQPRAGRRSLHGGEHRLRVTVVERAREADHLPASSRLVALEEGTGPRSRGPARERDATGIRSTRCSGGPDLNLRPPPELANCWASTAAGNTPITR
jgi:hypothetical protein